MAGNVSRGDVRLYQFGSPDKTRPVLVLTRDTSLKFLSTATVAPITASVRGVASEVQLNEEDGMKTICVVNLQNAVTVPQDRLGRRLAHLGPERMRQVCAALLFSLGCE